MEFDVIWVLLGLPVIFALGWLASRMDLRQLRLENRQAPKAYFKGLSYLLNEQQDQAIDAFIEAVQKDPDTSELHFALGNLFRRRGEYDRAVRVHQHLLSRADLSQAERDRAQHALALDYMKAGLLDRAEQALLKLQGTAFEEQAFLALLANYERSRDWALAADMARKLEARHSGSFASRLAHHLCEQAAALAAKGQTDGARALLQQAIEQAPQAARGHMEMARLQEAAGEMQSAYDTLVAALDASPAAAPLIARPLAELARHTRQLKPALDRLRQLYQQNPALDILEAIVQLSTATQDAPDDSPAARDWYARHLETQVSLVAAARWLAGEKVGGAPLLPQVQRALDKAAKPLLHYRCAACGFEASQHFWQCPGCQGWDTYPPNRVEEL